MLYHVISCYIMLYHVYHVKSCDIMLSCYIMSYMLYNVLSCSIMFQICPCYYMFCWILWGLAKTGFSTKPVAQNRFRAPDRLSVGKRIPFYTFGLGEKCKTVYALHLRIFKIFKESDPDRLSIETYQNRVRCGLHPQC